jgi:hypothetical protein
MHCWSAFTFHGRRHSSDILIGVRHSQTIVTEHICHPDLRMPGPQQYSLDWPAAARLPLSVSGIGHHRRMATRPAPSPRPITLAGVPRM